MKQVAPEKKSLDTFGLPSFPLPVPSVSQRHLWCFFPSSWISMQETYICLYTDRIAYKHRDACPGTWFSSLFPTKRNVSEPMDKEDSLNVFWSLFLPKRREREELFNIRPSLGCTRSISKSLWLQIRCKRDLARKVRSFLRPPSSSVYLNSRIAPTSYSLPRPLLSHLPPSLPCSSPAFP